MLDSNDLNKTLKPEPCVALSISKVIKQLPGLYEVIVDDALYKHASALVKYKLPLQANNEAFCNSTKW